MREIGKRLRYFRRKNKMSLREVEHLTGIKFGVIAAYERGDRKPSLDILKKIAAAYEVSPIRILFSEEEIMAAFPEKLQANAALLLERPEINELVTIIQQFSPQITRQMVEFIAALTAKNK